MPGNQDSVCSPRSSVRCVLSAIQEVGTARVMRSSSAARYWVSAPPPEQPAQLDLGRDRNPQLPRQLLEVRLLELLEVRLHPELLALLAGKAGDLVIFPLWPHQPFEKTSAAIEDEETSSGQQPNSAKRVIVRAVAGAKGPLRLAAGLVLHKANGNPTKTADFVLRQGGALVL